jgi:hypothetical protein
MRYITQRPSYTIDEWVVHGPHVILKLRYTVSVYGPLGWPRLLVLSYQKGLQYDKQMTYNPVF